jgi:hypothetical protein
MSVLNRFTRENLCLHLARHIKARDVIERLASLFIEPGSPGQSAYV